MSKAEKFIQDYTRNCSNELAHWDIDGENVKPIYSPWLTPDQARRAVEIAREETIKEIESVLPCVVKDGLIYGKIKDKIKELRNEL